MVLSIKDPETDRLERKLSDLEGVSITVAVRDAVEKRLERVELDNRRSTSSFDWMLDLLGRARERHSEMDARSIDELLYDEAGLPA